MIKLTIIIPVYNVEKYVIKTLESIKNQNIDFNQLQVLIIDDGSIDNSPWLIKQWIEGNSNKNTFQYIYKSNWNWGSVINYAKDKNLIKGKYISILDADDFYHPQCFEEIFSKIENDYDVIITNFFRINENKKIRKTKVLYSSKSKVMKNKKCFSPWSIPICKFFKTELFLSIPNLDEGISYQDQILFHSLVLKAKKIYFIKKCLGYYFELRPQSSTTLSWDKKRINIWCNNMNQLLSKESREIAAYTSMMLNYCYSNTDKKLRHKIKIDQKYIPLLKKSKFSFLPISISWIAKLYFSITNKKIIKNSQDK